MFPLVGDYLIQFSRDCHPLNIQICPVTYSRMTIIGKTEFPIWMPIEAGH